MTAPRILAAAGGLGWLALLLLVPAAALAGARVAFLFVAAAPIGAIALLLVARLTGADWDAALRPLLAGIAWLGPAAVPMIVEQAAIPRPPHLMLWLAWPAFALRTLAALGFWWWAARRLAAGGFGTTGAGLALVAHAVIVDLIAVDWIMGVAPAQPETAIGMALAVIQILAACAAACLLRRGPAAARRDLSWLLIAACLGLAYLLFVDFLVVWFGNLPARVGWYLARQAWPWAWLPPAALAIGLALPIAALAIGGGARARPAAAGGALAGLFAALCWLVAPIGGAAAIPAALAAIALAAPLASGRRAASGAEA